MTGAAIATTTVSTPVLLATLPVSFESSATTSTVRVPLTVLVVEKVTDCKAVVYWAGVALPLKVSTPLSSCR